MPGLTNNTNLLTAVNQLIQAINDLSGGEALNRIGDAIEAQTTVIETRSIAETTAQNTNFGNLITSVNGINLSIDTGTLVSAIQACCSNVNTNLGLMIGAIRAIRLVTNGGYGGNGGISGYPEVDPPPYIPEEPWTPPSEIDLERCKAANYVFWTITWYLRYISTLQGFGTKFLTESGAGQMIMGALMTMEGVAIVATGGMEAIVAAVLSLVVTAGNWLVVQYFEYLADSLEQDKQEIICNLYNSPDADQARTYIHTLIDARIDAVAALPVESLPPFAGYPLLILKLTLKEVAKTIAGNYLVNVLFEPSPDVQAAEIPDAIDCSLCGCDVRFDFAQSAEGWVSRSIANNNTVVNSWSTNEALRTEISMLYANTGATGVWEYFPGDHSQVWIVSEGDFFETRLNCTDHPSNGIYQEIWFTDQTSIINYQNVGPGGSTWTITIDATHAGKEVEKLLLNYHLGQASSPGSSSIAEWDYVQLHLAGGGC